MISPNKARGKWVCVLSDILYLHSVYTKGHMAAALLPVECHPALLFMFMPGIDHCGMWDAFILHRWLVLISCIITWNHDCVLNADLLKCVWPSPSFIAEWLKLLSKISTNHEPGTTSNRVVYWWYMGQLNSWICIVPAVYTWLHLGDK